MQNLVNNQRIPWIDVLRGIAIVLMIPANLSTLWSAEHPLWFRFLASYAAPTFIMLSTGMVILNANKYNFLYFFKRGLLLLGFGAFTDIFIWKIFPFVTYDVLYLIGVALPCIYLFRHASAIKLISIGFIIFLCAPLLQHVVGYHLEISEINWSERHWPGGMRLLEAWLIDGWFPIFPWLGVAFCGAAFFRMVFSEQNFLNKKIVALAVITTIAGIILLMIPTTFFNNIVNHGILAERSGYSEIFYPPTLIYVVTTLSMLVLFAELAKNLTRFRLGNMLSLFGRYSLLIYLLHQAAATYIFTPILSQYGKETISNGWIFAASVVLTMIAVYFICLMLDKIKHILPKPNFLFLQMVLGYK